MKLKQILAFLLTCFLCNLTTAQRLAENFTITDVDGNEIDLYETLEEGKIVMVNLFSTWCSPCIDFEELTLLESLWQEYGPDGTDELFLVSIEVHPSTSEGNIFAGDHRTFMEALTHPLANADIGRHFDHSYYGLYEICSNKIATKIFTFGNENITPGATNHCVLESKDLDVMILDAYIPRAGVCDDGIFFNPELSIQNVGLETVNEMKILLFQDGTVVDSVLVTEEMITHDYHTIFLPELFLDAPYSLVEFEITEINGQIGDDDLTNNHMEKYSFLEPTNDLNNNQIADPMIHIQIMTGSDGHELYWAIVNEQAEIIAEGGNTTEVGLQGGGTNNATPGLGYVNDSTYLETVILPADGCYEFIFVDAGGNLTGNGYLNYYLFTADTSQVIAAKSYGINSSYDKRPFQYNLPVNTMDQSVEFDLSLTPNPIFNNEFILNIASNDITEFSYEILNLSGVSVKNRIQVYLPNTENNSITVQLPDLPNGLYLVNIQGAHFTLTEKILVASN